MRRCLVRMVSDFRLALASVLDMVTSVSLKTWTVQLLSNAWETPLDLVRWGSLAAALALVQRGWQLLTCVAHVSAGRGMGLWRPRWSDKCEGQLKLLSKDALFGVLK